LKPFAAFDRFAISIGIPEKAAVDPVANFHPR
jgi:hypothetical protein